jgi:flagellar basal body rod protein FlgG
MPESGSANDGTNLTAIANNLASANTVSLWYTAVTVAVHSTQAEPLRP